jgi:hypothetical protein
MSADAVILEIAFAHVGPEDEDFQARFWPEVDEQLLNNDVRRRLAENGMRCGLLGSTLPVALVEILNRSENQNPLAAVEGDGSRGPDLFSSQQRMQSRAGKPGKIVVRNGGSDRLAVLTREDGRIRGETFEQAQCLFRVKTFPQGDGSVKLELTPEIEHGDAQTRYVGQPGGWLLEAGRQRSEYETMRIETQLRPGQTIVLATTAEPKGLGQQFFAADSADGLQQTLLLIRLQQTQRDDRFEVDDELAPLVSQ